MGVLEWTIPGGARGSLQQRFELCSPPTARRLGSSSSQLGLLMLGRRLGDIFGVETGQHRHGAPEHLQLRLADLVGRGAEPPLFGSSADRKDDAGRACWKNDGRDACADAAHGHAIMFAFRRSNVPSHWSGQHAHAYLITAYLGVTVKIFVPSCVMVTSPTRYTVVPLRSQSVKYNVRDGHVRSGSQTK